MSARLRGVHFQLDNVLASMGDSGNDKVSQETQPIQTRPQKHEHLVGMSLEKRKQNVRREILHSEARNNKQNEHRNSVQVEEMQHARALEERDVSMFRRTVATPIPIQASYYNKNDRRGFEDLVSPPRRPVPKRGHRNLKHGATSAVGTSRDHVRKAKRTSRASDETVHGLHARKTYKATRITPRTEGNGDHRLDISLRAHGSKIISKRHEGSRVTNHGSNVDASQRQRDGIPRSVDIPSRVEPSSLPFLKVSFDCFQFSSLAEAKKFLGIDPSASP